MPNGQSCTNYSSKDAFRNSVLAGMAGAAGTGVAVGVIADYYGKYALKKGLEKGCDIWSNNPTNYSDWLYPLSYYENVKQLLMDTIYASINDSDELKAVKDYENALYSVPEYVNSVIPLKVWGLSKQINPSGQLCEIPAYNLKHNLIEIHQGNAYAVNNLNKPEFKPFNELVYKILNGKTKVKMSRGFEKNMSFGGAGSILPYAGMDGIGGAYAQPSFGFGKKKRKRKRKVTKKRKRKTVRRKRKTNGKGKLQLKSIKRSTRQGKKYMATFIMPSGRTKTTHFGAAGMSDYTKHKDKARKQRYINRHKKRENWKDPTTAGALSLYILWNKPTLKASIADYKKRFGF